MRQYALNIEKYNCTEKGKVKMCSYVGVAIYVYPIPLKSYYVFLSDTDKK